MEFLKRSRECLQHDDDDKTVADPTRQAIDADGYSHGAAFANAAIENLVGAVR